MTARKKVNTTGTDENLLRLVSMPGHGAPTLELVHVPGHGAQIGAQAPTKGYVQAGAPSLNGALIRYLRL